MYSQPMETSSSSELLKKLNTWASFHEIQSDPYIRSITDSISTDTNRAFFASRNISDLLPTPSAKGASRFIRTARTLSILRNVLIFAPVAITWMAVAQATNAFDRYLKENTALPVNFLQFWQDGYGYLDSSWRISEVALVDFLIILFIAFLSVVIGISQQVGVNRTERFLRAESKRRAELVFELTMYFDKFHPTSTNWITDELRATSALIAEANSQALQALRSLQGGVDKLLDSVSQTTDGLASATSSLQSYSITLDSQSEIQQRKVASLVESIELLQSTISVIPQVAISESKQVAILIDKLSRVVNGELRQAVKNASKTLGSATKDISSSSTQIKHSTRTTKVQLEALQKQLARAEKAMQQK